MNPIFVGATIRLAAVAGVLVQAGPGLAQGLDPTGLPDLDQRTAGLQSKMVEWRRDIHQNPELSGQEARTSKLVADHLRALGLEVKTGVGGHRSWSLKGDRPARWSRCAPTWTPCRSRRLRGWRSRHGRGPQLRQGLAGHACLWP